MAQPGIESDQPQGYYNADRTGPAVYVLRREDKPGSYLLQEQIWYVSADGRAWVVPATKDTSFSTNLASIPRLATWLVPKDGSHTPAALIHDAMTLVKGETPPYAPADPPVTREEADKLFREGMQFLEVYFLRRWLMWAAVMVPTLFQRGGFHWLRRALLVLLAVFVVIGVFGIPDILDIPGAITLWNDGPTLSWHLHWVDEGSLFAEIRSFLTVTAAASVGYAVLWLNRWKFGLILGLGLSLLSFAMLVPAIAFGLYYLLEQVVAFFLIVRGTQGPAPVRSAEWVQSLAKRV